MQDPIVKRNLPQRYVNLEQERFNPDNSMVMGDISMDPIYLQDEIDDIKTVLGLPTYNYHGVQRVQPHGPDDSNSLQDLRLRVQALEDKLGAFMYHPTIEEYIKQEVENEINREVVTIRVKYDEQINELQTKLDKAMAIIKPKLHTFQGFQLRRNVNGNSPKEKHRRESEENKSLHQRDEQTEGNEDRVGEDRTGFRERDTGGTAEVTHRYT